MRAFAKKSPGGENRRHCRRFNLDFGWGCKRVVNQTMMDSAKQTLVVCLRQGDRAANCHHKIAESRWLLQLFCRHPHLYSGLGQFARAQVFDRIIGRARSQRSKQQLRGSHSSIIAAVLRRLVAHQLVCSCSNRELYAICLCNLNFNLSSPAGQRSFRGRAPLNAVRNHTGQW